MGQGYHWFSFEKIETLKLPSVAVEFGFIHRWSMGYRDENEGMRARVNALEGELDAAKHEIARLRGEVPDGEVQPDAKTEALIGRPTHVRVVRRVEVTPDDEAYAQVALLIRERFGGTAHQVGRTLTCRLAVQSGWATLEMRPVEGGVELVFEERTDGTPYLLAGGGATAVGFAAFCGLVALARATGLSPDHLVWMLPVSGAAATAGWWQVRRWLGQGWQKRERDVVGVLNTLEDFLQSRAPSVHVRVAESNAGSEYVDVSVSEKESSRTV